MDQIAHFESIHAAFLSIGPGAGVLKSWKKSASPSLESYLRSQVAFSFRPLLSKGPALFIPIPQSPQRKWVLSGGSVLRFTLMLLAAHPGASMLDLLEIDPNRDLHEENQARMKGDERYRRRPGLRMKALDPDALRRVLARDETATIYLVDDFLTSGATLRAALETLRNGFEESGLFFGRSTRISACVLGFRPTLFL